ncbi:sigma-E processing peptidase SpoIIGA [Tumebacillus sp. BK434]|uniref:sigma-E processing peptidase SpoIIGA n=1 Tax=Tumebacillus sp. BK434 TaxID=2512169 RepID=UPI00140475C3|nr:sigma-E processing peptidase SpoIIGA [Tumebacillus sp. BK434]
MVSALPVVYIDVIWLLNFGVDGFILLVTAFLARRRLKWWRTIGASAIGASYALFLFFPAMSAFLTFFSKLLFSILMVWIAFRPKGLFEFGKLLGLFYLASFLTGGAAYAANSFFGSTGVQNGLVLVHGGAVWLQQTKLWLVVLALPLTWLLGRSAWNRLARSKQREMNFWEVEVQLGGESVLFTGLLDTGNALTDPLSRTPVMVADWELFQSLLPVELTAELMKGSDIALSLGEIAMEDDWHAKFRLVPYRGVGGTMGMLLAFKPSLVILRSQEKEHNCTRVLIGLNPKALAADGSYRAILHPAMLEGEGDVREEWNADSAAS